MWSSLGIGSNPALSFTHTIALYTSHRLRASAGPLLDWIHVAKMEHGLLNAMDG